MKTPLQSVLNKYIGKKFLRNPPSGCMNNVHRIFKINKHITHFKTKHFHKEAMTTDYFLTLIKKGELIEWKK